jgi:hypothetical protein
MDSGVARCPSEAAVRIHEATDSRSKEIPDTRSFCHGGHLIPARHRSTDSIICIVGVQEDVE